MHQKILEKKEKQGDDDANDANKAAGMARGNVAQQQVKKDMGGSKGNSANKAAGLLDSEDSNVSKYIIFAILIGCV